MGRLLPVGFDETEALVAGYSNTPLAKKLGIKPGLRITTINTPANYWQLVGNLPPSVVVEPEPTKDLDWVHLFVTSKRELKKQLPNVLGNIKSNGVIWVSWPKKAARTATDLTEDVIRNHSLPLGLVDTKVCAVDDTWSGLKLVIRVSER
jgi:hypothetical protein